METINLDASGAVLGRLCSFAAKQALLGKKVNVFNCESAIISGDRRNTVARYGYLANSMGRPRKGPFFVRLPDRFVRRMIRGMLPHQARGNDAFDRVMCYLGVPSEFKKVKLQRCVVADASDLGTVKRVVVGDLVRCIGGRV